MPTETIIGMASRRWQSEHPFKGHAKDSLLRKLTCSAIREEIKAAIRRELQFREARRITD